MNDLIATLGTEGLQSTAAPDVFGYAAYLGPSAPSQWAGVRLSLRAPTAAGQDACYTNFPGSPAFLGIRVSDQDSLRVTLYDADLDQSDPIGTFDLTATDILAAAGQEGSVWLRVDDRTHGQVLALQFAVRQAASPIPNVRGAVFR